MAGLCAFFTAAISSVTVCDAPVKLYCWIDVLLAMAHFAFVIYAQKRIMPIFDGTSESKHSSADGLCDNIMSIMLYDIGVCLYAFAWFASVIVNFLLLGGVASCKGASLAAIAAYLFLLYAFVSSTGFVVVLLVMSCKSIFDDSHGNDKKLKHAPAPPFQYGNGMVPQPGNLPVQPHWPAAPGMQQQYSQGAPQYMNQGPPLGMQPMQQGPGNVAPSPYGQHQSAQMQAQWSTGGPQMQAPWKAAGSGGQAPFPVAGGPPMQAQPQPQPLYTEQRQGQPSTMPGPPPAAVYKPAQAQAPTTAPALPAPTRPPLQSGQAPSAMPPLQVQAQKWTTPSFESNREGLPSAPISSQPLNSWARPKAAASAIAPAAASDPPQTRPAAPRELDME